MRCQGVDLALENVGGEMLPLCMACLRMDGTLVAAGQHGGRYCKVDVELLYRRHLNVLGTRGATRLEQKHVLELAGEGNSARSSATYCRSSKPPKRIERVALQDRQRTFWQLPAPIPGKLNYSSPYIGSPPHMGAALLAQQTGVQMVHIAYKEASQVYNAVGTDGTLFFVDSYYLPDYDSTNNPTPPAIEAAPSARLTQTPNGRTFSASTANAINAIHSRFMLPATKSSAIKSQQQPRQYRPCRSPMMNAPRTPLRHSDIRNPIGVRHFARHAFFTGVN